MQVRCKRATESDRQNAAESAAAVATTRPSLSRALRRAAGWPIACLPAALACAALIPLGPAPASAAAWLQPADGEDQADDDGSLRDMTGAERRQRLLDQRAQAEAASRDRRAEMMRRQAGGDDPTLMDGADADTEPQRIISFEAFAEGLELRALVDYVAETLELNMIIRGELDGSVVFNARQDVPVDQLFRFMESLLDQFGFAVTLDDDTGFYTIAPLDDLTRAFDGELGTTRIIATPAVRPSSLQTALGSLFGGATQAQQGRGAAATASSGGVTLSYVDDLGIIIASGPPRRLRQVELFVERLLTEYDRQEFFTIQLSHVAAPAARQRLVELVSRSAGGGNTRNPRANQANENVAIAGFGSSIDNLAERLTADPSSNALIFRGLSEEADQVRRLIEGIDRPTLLVPRKYFAGSAARQIADIASQRGLGEVISLDSGGGIVRQPERLPARPAAPTRPARWRERDRHRRLGDGGRRRKRLDHLLRHRGAANPTRGAHRPARHRRRGRGHPRVQAPARRRRRGRRPAQLVDQQRTSAGRRAALGRDRLDTQQPQPAGGAHRRSLGRT
ncbi:MAG: hypothetical protein AAF138_03190 [Planctomycetota bacterium]